MTGLEAWQCAAAEVFGTRIASEQHLAKGVTSFLAEKSTTIETN